MEVEVVLRSSSRLCTWANRNQARRIPLNTSCQKFVDRFRVSGGEAQSKHAEGFDPLSAHPFQATSVRYGAGPSFRTVNLGCRSCLSILGVQAPACLYTRLFTSRRLPCRASARRVTGAAGWPHGPGRGPPVSFLSPSDLRSGAQGGRDSSKEEDFLPGYKTVRAMRRSTSTVHARLTRTASTCASLTSGIPREMLNDCPFDIGLGFQSSTEK
jgi:hypothetical protein